MSLKKFHFLVVLLSLSGLTVIYFYIANALQENIDTHVKSSIHGSAVELRQHLRSDFSVLQQRFANYESISLEKLEQVSEAIEASTDKPDLYAIADTINKNVFDGHYELYIINDDKVVEASTSLNDIGLDYSGYPYFSSELDQLKSGGITYKITAPMFDESVMDMLQYYVVRSSNNSWIMLGFVLPFDEYVNHKAAKLQSTFPALKELDLYILTYDYLQHINTRKEVKDINVLYQKSRQYTQMMIKELGLDVAEGSAEIEAIAEQFSQKDIVTLPQANGEETFVYALIKSSTENDSDDFMLIAKMDYNDNYFRVDYSELKNLLHLLVGLVYLFLVIGFLTIHVSIITKITSIAQQMERDDTIAASGFLFKELAFFIERYNNFLGNWKEQVRILHDITLQDELTKSANRRFFNQKMKEQIDLYERYGVEFSLIMFDIDDFKAVNDIFGHSMGDHVLSKMAADVQKQLRASDVLCRIGGEEFAVILPETNRQSALFVAEKIRKRIEHQVYIEGRKVTVSLGVESYSSQFDFNSFYTTVDAFLYKSKTSGKNCVNSSVSLSS